MNITQMLVQNINGEILQEIAEKSWVEEKKTLKICENGIPLLLAQIWKNAETQIGADHILELLERKNLPLSLDIIFEEAESAILFLSHISQSSKEETTRVLNILVSLIFDSLRAHARESEDFWWTELSRLLAGTQEENSIFQEYLWREKKKEQNPDEKLKPGMGFLKKILTKKK